MSRAARAVAPFPSRVLAGILLAAWAASPVHAQEVIEYYGTDALGSIRVVFDASGTVVARTDYLPFGETFEASGNGPAEGFTGQARDGEAGLDYFHARMYQPRTGRFNAVDPVYAGLFDPQQWNRYSYARNNPLRFVDPLGLELQCTKTEYWENVDVDNGPGGGKRDSIPTLRVDIVCADFGETTPPPIFHEPPTARPNPPPRGNPGGTPRPGKPAPTIGPVPQPTERDPRNPLPQDPPPCPAFSWVPEGTIALGGSALVAAPFGGAEVGAGVYINVSPHGWHGGLYGSFGPAVGYAASVGGQLSVVPGGLNQFTGTSVETTANVKGVSLTMISNNNGAFGGGGLGLGPGIGVSTSFVQTGAWTFAGHPGC